MKTGRGQVRYGMVVSMLVFGIIYSLTLSPGAYPGVSARLISEQTALTPVLSPANPLWRGAAAALRVLPGDNPVARLNRLSAICATLTIGLLYVLMHDIVLLLIGSGMVEPDRRARMGAHLAGAGAVVFLGFSIPFWQIATRAHVAALDLLILLSMGVLLVKAHQGGRYGTLWMAVALYSVGTAGFATLLAFLPLVLPAMVYVVWEHGLLGTHRAGRLAGLGLAAISGLGVVLLAAWRFYGSDGYTLRAYTSYGQVVWFMLRDLYLLLSRGLPRTGWLIIVFASIVPWIVMLAVGQRGMNDERDRGSALLHLILTVMAASVLLNSRFAPWSMLGAERLLVTPYVLMAMVYGYLTAYWFLLPARWWPTEREGRWQPGIVAGWGLVLPMAGLLAWAPVRNYPEADARSAALFDVFAELVVDSLHGRQWLITDGSLDTHIQLAAHKRGAPVNVITALPQVSSLYRRYIASLFDDPHLRNLAAVGILPLTREWMVRDAEIGAKLAVMIMPELWLAGGYTPVPAGLVYLGTAGTVEDALPADVPGPYAGLWERLVPVAERLDTLPDDAQRLALLFMRHAGRIANNFGVALEDAGRDADAAQAYRQARQLDPDNVSARLNLAVMVEQGRLNDDDGFVAAGLAEIDAMRDSRFEIWSLAQHFGYVRLPQAFADVGWRWALSGRPELAAARLEQALAMSDAVQPQIQHMMARLKLAQGETETGTRLLANLLEQNPDDPLLILQLAREKARARQFDEAVQLVARARAAGAAPLPVALAEAFIALLQQDAGAVRQHLRDAARRHPDEPGIWTLLCEAALLDNDRQRFDDAFKRLDAIEGIRGYNRSMLKGRIALADRQYEAARLHFETALRHRPQSLPLLETLLQISIFLHRKDAAQAYIERLLGLNQRHAFALHMMGSIQVSDGNLAAAEASLRASLAEHRTPAVLNDLAWVLALRENYQEAEQLSRQSLALLHDYYAFHDTLGTILLRTGRYEEAARAFEQSLALAQHNPGIILRMAECQFRLGNRTVAQAMVDPFIPRMDLLLPEDREQLLRLRALMRQ